MTTVGMVKGINGAMTKEAVRALHVLDEKIIQAVDMAKINGVAQGLIVAVLQAHAMRETKELI